jgi:hypothetical protein
VYFELIHLPKKGHYYSWHRKRPIKSFTAAAPAYHFLVLNISKARMNNNQRNKLQQATNATAQPRNRAPACGSSSGARAQQQHLLPFAIGPKGASKNPNMQARGVGVAMPDRTTTTTPRHRTSSRCGNKVTS